MAVKSRKLYAILAVLGIFLLAVCMSGFTVHAEEEETNYTMTAIDGTEVNTKPDAPKKLNVIIFGTDCGQTIYALENISKQSWIKDPEVGFYYADLYGSEKDEIKELIESYNFSSEIVFCYNRNRGILSNLLWDTDLDIDLDDISSRPIVLYIGEDGTVQNYSYGSSSARQVYSNICKILGREYNPDIKVHFNATVRAKEARKEFKMINAFRTSATDAWYWNSDDKTKTECENLSALKYDYELEKVAIERAKELVVLFDHTRPNDESCTSLYPEGRYSAMGENIAAGYKTAEAVMENWKETNQPYAFQGHRRNMLSADFNAVGVACVEVNGIRFWVQEFGYTDKSSTAVTYPEKEARCEVALADTMYSTADVKLSDESYNISVDQVVSGELGPYIQEEYYKTPLYLPSTWKVTNTSILSKSGDSFKGIKAGTTTIKLTYEYLPKKTKTQTIKVTVKPIAMGNAKLTLAKTSVTYTGKAFTPKVTVTFGSKKLTQGTDYTIRYKNNIKPGKATVEVTGKGNYSGTKKVQFTIKEDPKAKGYLAAIQFKNSQLKMNLKIFDKTTGGKYKITGITKKNGKVTAGTLRYMAPYNTSAKSVVIPATLKIGGVKFKVTSIAGSAFKDNKKITKLTIGAYVKEIGAKAIAGCSKLQNVIIKSTKLKTIGKNACKGTYSKIKYKVPKAKRKKYLSLITNAGAPKKAKVVS